MVWKLINNVKSSCGLTEKFHYRLFLEFPIESWNREELPVAILKRIISFGDASPELMNTPFIEIYDKSKKWIEENL
jgi:hypothetical protein